MGAIPHFSTRYLNDWRWGTVKRFRKSTGGLITAFPPFAAVPAGRLRAAPGCNNGSFSPPVRPPGSQHHIPSRGHRAHLLPHIKAAPGEAREGVVAETCREREGRSSSFLHSNYICNCPLWAKKVQQSLRNVIFGPVVNSWILIILCKLRSLFQLSKSFWLKINW